MALKGGDNIEDSVNDSTGDNTRGADDSEMMEE